ncbi:MAG TPA: hypothetical protein VKO83_13115 [Steroidobacteraceae bacterium]|nr:hypothetical protein [Steroidobacteraceae bacterium]
MSTFWQLLRIGFWMLPLQRALTVIGFMVLAGGQLFHVPLNSPGSTLPITFLGVMLMMIIPLLAGGAFLRMLSSSRALLLRPHARGRLLAGSLGILLLVTLTWVCCYWMAFQAVPPKYRPGVDQYALMFTLTISFGTLCTVALFIASRSPLWTLIVLLVWQAPAVLLHAFGVEDASRLNGGPVSLATTALTWLIFAIWYLRTRRIHATAWRRRDDTAGPASAAMALDPVSPLSHEQAMFRWVLANATPVKLGLQSLLACLVLLAIQWGLGREAGARPLQAIMFGALSAVAVVTGALGSSMARRSRALWLPSGRTRLELHGWIERKMLQMVLAVLAAVALAAVPVWLLLTPRPALPPGYLLGALLLPGLCAGWLGLMQQHQRSFFDALAGIGIAAGIFYGVVQPLYMGSAEPRWGVLGGEIALAVLLREVAYVRWRGADWRRAQQA